MTEQRAILVSSEQIRLIDECTGESPADQPLRDLCAAYDAAPDYPGAECGRTPMSNNGLVEMVRFTDLRRAGYTVTDSKRLMRRAAKIAGGGIKPGRYWYVPRSAFEQAVAETREKVKTT